jgi:S-DNA-T family DNA segregation ATPase FtsK/SpoIIIE
MTIIEGDVIRAEDGSISPSSGAITPVRGHLATQHVQVLHGLLPQPASPLHEWPGRAGLAERAVAGMVHGALEYKAVLLAPLGVAMSEALASVVHFAPHHVLAGGVACTLGVAASAFVGFASLAHITNPPTPHQAATHHGGHHGKIIGTAFGIALTLFELGTTIWFGPMNAVAWGAGMLATVGGTIGIGVAVHHTTGHRQVRDTDRIRAVAEFAAATAIDPVNYAPPATRYDQHPLSMEVLYALSVLGWPGATVDAMPVVVNPSRWTLTVNLPDGVAFKTVKAKEPEIAATLRIVSGGLTLSQGRGSHQAVFSVNNLAIAELPKPGIHPAVEAPGQSVSIWDPIRFGHDDDSSNVDIVLAGTPGILLAGAPGSGKSNAVAEILCHVTQAVDCELWTIDGSGRELVIFDEVAHQHTGTNMDVAIAFLDALQTEITRRGTLLAEHRATELTRALAEDLELDCICYAIGELAYFTAFDDAKKKNTFNLKLRDLVSRGRAAGVFGVFDTQKPEDRTVPSSIRDMVPFKFALRCETDDQVNTILGKGMAKHYPAHEIDLGPDGLGVGYLKGVPGRKPFRTRTHPISPKERYEIVDAVKAGFVAPPPIVPGPGGGLPVDDVAPASGAGPGWRGTHLRAVHSYPDGTPFENETFSAVWQLLERLPEGFTYRDVATLLPSVGLYGGRGTVQKYLDSWRDRGLIVEVGERRGQAGPPTAVYQRADRPGYGEESA